jgi:hypothetical protein
MFRDLLDGRKIEVNGSHWEVAVRDHYCLGSYHVVRLDLIGNTALELTLRIRSESVPHAMENGWLLESIRSRLQLPFSLEHCQIWL